MDTNNYDKYHPFNDKLRNEDLRRIYQNPTYQNQTSNPEIAYSTSRPFIKAPDFTNPNTTLYNNLNKDLFYEQVQDYYVNIDSDDRKVETYPDPFFYTVSFNAIGRSTGRSFNGDHFEHADEYPETPAPVIDRNFKNVKYVKLDRVILSRYTAVKFIIKQEIVIKNNKTYVDDSCTTIEKRLTTNCMNGCEVCCSSICNCSVVDTNKFIVLKVKELQTQHMYATNTFMSDNSFVLYVDKTLGSGANIWFPTYGYCNYPKTLLSNLNRLTIDFYKKNGEKMNPRVTILYEIKLIVDDTEQCFNYLLLFGNYGKIKKVNNSINYAFGDVFKYDLWVDRIMGDVSYKSGVPIQCDSITRSIRNLDIEKLVKETISNNVFFIIGTMENELNTMTKYVRS